MQNSSNSPLIVCSTSRLARSLQQEYAQTKINQQLESWQPLNVKTLDSWLDEILGISLLSNEIDSGLCPNEALERDRRALNLASRHCIETQKQSIRGFV